MDKSQIKLGASWLDGIGTILSEVIGVTLEFPLEQKPTAYGYAAVGFRQFEEL